MDESRKDTFFYSIMKNKSYTKENAIKEEWVSKNNFPFTVV